MSVAGVNDRRFIPAARRTDSRGQAMIESLVVLLALLTIFLFLFQFTDIFTAKLMLSHAASRAARARAVGMNSYMVVKSARVAMIPASGARITPSNSDMNLLNDISPGDSFDNVFTSAVQMGAGSEIARAELNRIPLFLAAENDAVARAILDYELWDATDIRATASNLGDTGEVHAEITQKRPLFNGLEHESPSDGIIQCGQCFKKDYVDIRGEYDIENHASLYLEDTGL